MAIRKYVEGMSIKAGDFVTLDTMISVGFAGNPARVVDCKPASVVVEVARRISKTREVEFEPAALRRLKSVSFVCDTLEEAEQVREASMAFTKEAFALQDELALEIARRKALAIEGLVAPAYSAEEVARADGFTDEDGVIQRTRGGHCEQYPSWAAAARVIVQGGAPAPLMGGDVPAARMVARFPDQALFPEPGDAPQDHADITLQVLGLALEDIHRLQDDSKAASLLVNPRDGDRVGPDGVKLVGSVLAFFDVCSLEEVTDAMLQRSRAAYGVQDTRRAPSRASAGEAPSLG